MGNDDRSATWRERAREATYTLAMRVNVAHVRRRLERIRRGDPWASSGVGPFMKLAHAMWAAPEGGREARIALEAARTAAAAHPPGLAAMLDVFFAKIVHPRAEDDATCAASARPSALGTLWIALRSQRLDIRRRGYGTCTLEPVLVPSHVTAFLLDPASQARHRPAVRAVAALDDPGRHDRERRRRAEGLVHAAIAEGRTMPADSRDFGPFSGLLARTDQPYLLNALVTAFHAALDSEVFRLGGGSRPMEQHRLWQGTSPAVLTRMLLANPHLCPPPPEEEGSGLRRGSLPAALLKGRRDHADRLARTMRPHDLLKDLEKGLHWPALSAECRRMLRRLEDPVARSLVCERAVSPVGEEMAEEMRAAAADAGYVPSGLDEPGRAAFLFATEQWERYDAADPDGSLARRYFAEQPGPEGRRWWDSLRSAAERAAERSGRPSPVPAPPPPPPPARDSAGTEPRPLGSWHTGFGMGVSPYC